MTNPPTSTHSTTNLNNSRNIIAHTGTSISTSIRAHVNTNKVADVVVNAP